LTTKMLSRFSNSAAPPWILLRISFAPVEAGAKRSFIYAI
jgi:hypothetical protein